MPVTEFGALFCWNRMTTAGPAGRLTDPTLSRRKAGSAHRNPGTSEDLALATVGAAEAGDHLKEMEKRSCAKETVDPGPVFRAHPSG